MEESIVNQSEQQENKMGTMPVGKLLVNMSLPMMISMLVQACYNVVDSVFVSNIGGAGSIMGEHALTAVSMAFPLQTLMIAVGAGTGVGVNALLSKSLGEKKYDRVNQTAMNGLFLYIISTIVFMIIGATCVKPFYASQIKNADPEIMVMGEEYLSIVLIYSFGLFSQFLFERLLNSTGRTLYSMISQLCGAVTNIILDPILIFGLLGAPEMGVAGAAIATVIGQCVGGAVGLFCNLKYNKEIRFYIKGFRPNLKIIGMIYKVGFPSIIMQSIGSVMTYGMNLILTGFTSTATAVFGAYFKLQSFFYMPLFGMNNGITPIIAYNYGAQNRKRMVKTVKLSYIVAFFLMVIGIVGFELFPQKLLGIFNASEEMLAIGVPALRIIGIHFLISWFPIISGTVFQALGNGVYSLVVSVMRQLVVLLPVAFLLSKTGNVKNVWWSFLIAEVMSALTSAFYLSKIYRLIIKPLPAGRD